MRPVYQRVGRLDQLGGRLAGSNRHLGHGQALPLQPVERGERVEVGQVVTGEQASLESARPAFALDHRTLPGNVARRQLEHHLAGDECHPRRRCRRREPFGENGRRAGRIRRLAVVHGHRPSLVLDPSTLDEPRGRRRGLACWLHLRGRRSALGQAVQAEDLHVR